jgi:hypothetical protein
MIIVGAPEYAANAVSFTDDVKPDARNLSKKRHVSISAKVNKGAPLDWFYDLLNSCLDEKGELKSDRVVPVYQRLGQKRRAKLWDTLKEVQINITDSLPYQARMHQNVKDALKREDAIDWIRQRASAKDPYAMKMQELLNNQTAESILFDAPSKRLSWNIHYAHNRAGYSLKVGSIGRPRPPDHKIDLEHFKSSNPGSIVRAATEWTAKSASAFSEAIDSTFTEYFYPYQHPALNPVYKALRKSHAFDEGNKKSIGVMEYERKQIAREMSYHDYWEEVYPLEPLHGEIDSKKSFFMQASDIAVGIAKYLYEQREVLEVTLHFEYVMFNGRRITQNDAYETIMKWRQLGYYN